MSTLLLAVDGGATKTTLVLLQDGVERFSVTSTGSNYQAIGQQRVRQLFTDLFQQVAQVVTERTIAVAVFGIAGIDTEADALIVREMIEDSIASSSFTMKTCFIENDVEATLRGISTEAATLLISGTGAICYSFDGVQTIRIGGWGHRIGDEGSGYWIGQQIGRAIVCEKDGRGLPTVLTKLVLDGNQLMTTDALVNWIYAEDYTNARLASLGSYLQQAVDLGDAIAQEIAQVAATALAHLVLTALQHAQYSNQPHTLYINGGVLKHNPAIFSVFIQQIQHIYPQVHYELCDLQPIDYLIQRAKNSV